MNGVFEFMPCRPDELEEMLEHRPRRAMVELMMREMREGCFRMGMPVAAHVEVVGPINDGTETRVRAAIADSWKCSLLKVYIDSPGGYGRSGARIAGDLDQLKKRGVRIETIAKGLCASAACFIYVCGHERTAYPDTRFVLHRAAVDPKPATRLTAPHLREVADYIDGSDKAFLAKLHASRTRLTEQMMDAYNEGEDVCLDVRDAVGVGLVHHVIDRNKRKQR